MKSDSERTGEAAVAGAAPCSAIVWTSQKFGPEKEEWSPEEIAQWEQDCQPLEWCECGARMTARASAEWLGEKCGDCRDWNKFWNGDDEEESAALDKRIRKAVEADFQQWMIDSLTPDRGYMTPIDNVRALILELVPPNSALCEGAKGNDEKH